jgi:hypothetical protein
MANEPRPEPAGAVTRRRPEERPPPRAQRRRSLDERLDAALAETFPASDPVAITVNG